MLSHGLNRCMQQMGSAQESPNTCMVKEIRRFLAGGTRRPHLSVGALKRPAKKDALVCMIALEGPSYRPALQKHQHNAPLFYHTKHTSVEPNGDTLSLYEILCTWRIWMDFTWWRKLGERNRQWEHVGLYNIHATNHHCCWKTTTTSWHFGRWFSNLHTPSNLKGTYTIVDNNSINDVHHSRQR